MHKDKYNQEALFSAKRDYDCHFDDSFLPLRRNLLFVSLLSFAAINVTPKDGNYSINLGVIAGKIEDPEYIFIGLLCVCAYHLYMFWIKCRHTVINSINYPKVKATYMFRLSAIHAFADWNKLIAEHVNKGVNIGGGSFTNGTNQSSANGYWKVRTSIYSQKLETEPNFKLAIEANPKFKLKPYEGMCEIEYLYQDSSEDNTYLNIHRDHFWLTKRSQFIENVLPIIVGFSAILLVVYKISTLMVNGL
ncbi:hypothetical protein OLEAN_C17050 [Oleispira antarctica RB-8]|uniref:Uncharacterized protein n=1 Tax=Oleispira antarctica RB-8 TaxID=698738 RepID=R4YLY9_OLEAN|nr:hypothetical protein OLEAN_C17050 [Oleispira antarctica RB-8]